MKKLLILIIDSYKAFISVILTNLLGTTCRFEETCSSYSRRMIEEQGIFKGLYLSVVRVLKCQPFYKGNLYGNI